MNSDKNIYHDKVILYLMKNKSAKNRAEIRGEYSNDIQYKNAIDDLFKADLLMKTKEGIELRPDKFPLNMYDGIRNFIKNNDGDIFEILRSGNINAVFYKPQLRMSREQAGKILLDSGVGELLKENIDQVMNEAKLNSQQKRKVKNFIKYKIVKKH